MDKPDQREELTLKNKLPSMAVAGAAVMLAACNYCNAIREQYLANEAARVETETAMEEEEATRE